MWVEAVELFMETVCPDRWEQYQRARYDYEGYVYRWDVEDYRGMELWCKAPGKRYRPVQVVNVDGKRMRVRDF